MERFANFSFLVFVILTFFSLQGKAAARASAPPAAPTTKKMDYVAVPGMDTGSPAFLRSMALNSKRARGEKDGPLFEHVTPASRTAHRLFPDGGLLEYSSSFFLRVFPLR